MTLRELAESLNLVVPPKGDVIYFDKYEAASDFAWQALEDHNIQTEIHKNDCGGKTTCAVVERRKDG